MNDDTPQLHLLTGTGTLRDGDLTIADFSGKIGAKSRVPAASGTLKQVASSKGPVPDLAAKAELDVQTDVPGLLVSFAKAGIADMAPHVRRPQGHVRIEMAVRAAALGGAIISDGSIQLREVAFSLPTLKTDVLELTGIVTVSNDGVVFDTVALNF